MRHAGAMETPEERVARLLQCRLSWPIPFFTCIFNFIPCIWLQKLLAAVTKTTQMHGFRISYLWLLGCSRSPSMLNIQLVYNKFSYSGHIGG